MSKKFQKQKKGVNDRKPNVLHVKTLVLLGLLMEFVSFSIPMFSMAHADSGSSAPERDSMMVEKLSQNVLIQFGHAQ